MPPALSWERLMARARRHPRILGLSVLGAGTAVLLGVFVAPAVFLVTYAYVVSPQGATLAAWFFLGLMILSFAPWFLLRERSWRPNGAARKLHLRAEAGDPAAMRQVARDYLSGRTGTPRNESQGLWWLQKLAEGGDLPAAVELARHLREGRGIPRDRALALEWLRWAKERGSGQATHLLGLWERDQT